MFQYNNRKEVSQEVFCKAIFDNEITYQKQFIYKKSPPVNLENRLAKSDNFDSSQHVDIQNCLKKIDESVFKGSLSYQKAFDKFDKDKDGFVSENDFVETMKQQNILSEQESKEVFDYFGGNQGKY